MDDLLNTQFLFASLFWGSVGVGYWIYGKKQSELWPMLGGAAMIAVSYFVRSAVFMSLICIGIGFAVYALMKRAD
ncbi:MAG: amino acid transport protein [Verrucomicrobia bacterium]|nr:MAG: amino acid transport protein [Verrucomicrobiota bacterium]